MDPATAESENPLVLARDRAERAEQRLLDALESISDGFALYDAEDRLVYVNDNYLSINKGRREDYRAGITFEEVAWLWARSGQMREAIGREEDWVAERIASHRSKNYFFLRQLTDGRWIRGTETVTSDGSLVVMLADVTRVKESEDALRDSELRFRAVVEASPAAINVKDLEGRYVVSNAIHAAHHGKHWDQIVGLTERELVAESSAGLDADYDEAVLERDRQVAASGQPMTGIEEWATDPEGRRSCWLTTKLPLRDPDGETRHILTLSHDITERKRAEQALKDSEQRFRDFADAASDWFWEMDENLRFSHFSDQYWQVDPKIPELMIGKTRRELVEADDALIDATTSREDWLAHVADLEAHRPFRNFVHARRHPDGALRYYALSGIPHFGAEGAFKGYRGVAQHITARKRAEQELLRREEQLSEAQRIGRMGHWRFALDKTNLEWSDELWRLYGVDRFSFQPSFENVTAMIHADDRDRFVALRQRAVDTAQPYVCEVRILRPDGEIRHVRIEGRVELDDDGKTTALFGITQDITEQKQADEKLRRRERELSEAQRIGRIGHWRWDKESDRVERSDEACRLMGLTPSAEGFPGQEGDAMIHPDDRQQYLELFYRSIGSGQDYETGYRLVRTDGETRVFKEIGHPKQDRRGRATGAFGIIQDITGQKQAEESLRQRERELSEAQRIGRLGHWRYFPEQKISHCSEGLCRIYGIEPDNLVWTDEVFFDATHEEDRAESIAATERIIAQGLPQDVTFRIVRSDGEIRTLRSRRHPELDADGKVLSVFGINQDVTEQVQAEEALRQRGRELSEAQRIGHIGHWRTFPEDGRIALSDEMRRIYGVDPANFELTLESVNHLIHEDDRQQVLDQRARSFENGETYTNECRIIRPDDDIRHLWTSAQPELDNSGKVVSVFGVSQDITEKKQAEAALGESEQRNRAIVEALDRADVGVCIQKFGQEVNFVNSALAQLAGYDSPEDLTDRTWVKLQGEGGTNLLEIQDDILESLRKSGFWSGELEWMRPDGARTNVDVRTAPFPGEQVIHILTDITERKARERRQAELTEQLRQSQKMEALGQLAGGTAHEINNLLHPIITFAKLGYDRVEDEKLQHYLERIMECGRRAKEVVGDVLTFARKAPGKREEVDLTDLLARSLRFARDLVPLGIELDAAFPDHAGHALANETEFIQVVLNLVKNAADALGGDGTIRLGARIAQLDEAAARRRALDPGAYLQISVRDQGCGMTQETKQHIFEPFFTTKPVGEGTGLGLAVAYGIVQEWGGAITVLTEPGEGSTFTVYLRILDSTNDSGEVLSA